MKWDLYWTPLRFPAIHKLSLLCDQELLENAWSLCIARDVDKRTTEIVALLTELRERSKTSNMDHRTKELFDAAFGYGVANPQALDFGATDQKIYSPNATGFQFVLSSMARRLRAANRKDALSIKVDRQSEFNASQASAHYVQRLIGEGLSTLKGDERRAYLAHPLHENSDEEDLLRKGMPKRRMEFEASESSIGLQLVDIHLWIMRRAQSGAGLSDELAYLEFLFQQHAFVDGISLEGMRERWNTFERKLPAFEDISEEQRAWVEQSIEEHRQKVSSLNI